MNNETITDAEKEYQKQRAADEKEADRNHKRLMKHNNTKLTVDSRELAMFLDDLTKHQEILILRAQKEYMDADDTEAETIPFILDQARGLWCEFSDEQRIEVIKSLIWTATNAQEFYGKLMKEIGNEKFEGAID